MSAGDPSDTVLIPIIANGMVLAAVYGNGLVGLAAWNVSRCAAPPCAPACSLPGAVSDHPVVSDGAIYFLVKTGFGSALRKLSLPG